MSRHPASIARRSLIAELASVSAHARVAGLEGAAVGCLARGEPLVSLGMFVAADGASPELVAAVIHSRATRTGDSRQAARRRSAVLACAAGCAALCCIAVVVASRWTGAAGGQTRGPVWGAAACSVVAAVCGLLAAAGPAVPCPPTDDLAELTARGVQLIQQGLAPEEIQSALRQLDEGHCDQPQPQFTNQMAEPLALATQDN